MQDAPRSKHQEPPIRIVIAMTEQLERMAWGIIVRNQPDMQLTAQAASRSEVLPVLKANNPDVTLIDEAMLDARRCRDLHEYSTQPRSSRFILVAPHEMDCSLEQSRYSFTHAYLLKGVSATELLDTIRETAGARHP
jgi:DNA-binding NarL/FixJ family response regulator